MPATKGTVMTSIVICTLAIDGWVGTFGVANRELGGCLSRPLPCCTTVTTHPKGSMY